MKILTIFFYSQLFLQSAYSQKLKENQTFYNFESFKVGDSIEKFKQIISCVGLNKNNITNEEFSCKSFQFLPFYIDSVEIANIKFNNISLNVDDHKKIKSFGFIKSYKKQNSVTLIKLQNQITILCTGS